MKAKDKRGRDDAEENKREEEEDLSESEDGDLSKEDGDMHKPAGMDAKSLIVMISERNALAEKLSQHIGTFDHADKTYKEVVRYGVKKLGLRCKPGHE